MPNTILKRWNGTAFEELYPKTTVGQISASGTPSATTFLRGDGQWVTPAGGERRSYSSISGTSGAWYDLFTIDGSETSGALLISIQTWAHDDLLFTVGRGYVDSNVNTITILNCVYNPSGPFASISGVRITNTGLVQAQFTWSSGPGVDIDVAIYGSGTLPTLNASLTANATSYTINDTVSITANLQGKMRSQNGFVQGTTPIPAGIGTTNQIAYWSATNTIGTLSTATYPSLTELSYIKGLSSAVQTQLNDKAATSHTHSIGYYNSALTSNLDTLFSTGEFGFDINTTGRPEDFGQGINIVNSGTAYNGTNNWITQLAFGTAGSTSYFRTKVNTAAWSAWRKLWNDANDGTGSGLDADLLDGQHGSYFLDTSGSTQTKSGSLNISGSSTVTGGMSAGRFYQTPNGSPTNNLGTPSVTEMALFDEQFDNKTAFYDILKISAQTSTDNITWTEFSLTDAQKRGLVGGDNGTAINIPYNTPYFRFKFLPSTYVFANALYAYWSSQGHTTAVQIYKKHDSGSYSQHTSSTTQVTSWPGHLYLPFTQIPWMDNGTLGTHFDDIYIVFIPTWNATYSANPIQINKLQIWGGYPAGRRNLFFTDDTRNVTFPAALNSVGNLSTNANLTVGSGISTADAGINVGNGRTGSGSAFIDLIGDTTYSDFGLRVIRGAAGANAESSVIHKGTGLLKLRTEEAGAISLETSSTERMRITSTGLVGIGTTTIDEALTVNGTMASPISLQRNSGTDANNSVRYKMATESWYAGVSSNKEYAIRFNNADLANSPSLSIETNGQVGVNTNNPGGQLQVNSGSTTRVPLIVDTQASHNTNLAVLKDNGTDRFYVNKFGSVFAPGIYNLIADKAYLQLSDNGAVMVRNIADSNPALIVNLANASSTGDILKLQKAGADVYAFTHDGTLKAPATFTIDPSTHGNNTGKVIILGDLQVDGTTTTINSTTLEIDDKNIELSKGAANKAASDGAGVSIDLGTDGVATLLYGSTADRFAINKGIDITGELLLAPTSTTGQISFGATTSYLKRDNNFDLSLGQNSDSSGVLYLTSRGDVVVNIDADNNGTTNKFFVRSNTLKTGGTDLLTVTDGGNVGIGTTAPGEKLEVNGNAKATTFISTQATGTAPLTVASTTAVTNLNADLLDGNHASDFLLNSAVKEQLKFLYIYGKAESAITKGQAVQFAGVQGDHILLKAAVPSEINANPDYFVGIAESTLATNDFGYILTQGELVGVNTNAYTEGDILWFASAGSTAGALTATEPTGANAKIQVASVNKVNASAGIIFVRVNFIGTEIEDIVATGTASSTTFLRGDGQWATPTGGGTVTGTGTSNLLTYWTGTSSIGSLATTTYPSLTELSYVKGVTSALQTQLNGKAPTSHADSATTYGVGTNTNYGHIKGSRLINANDGEGGITIVNGIAYATKTFRSTSFAQQAWSTLLVLSTSDSSNLRFVNLTITRTEGSITYYIGSIMVDVNSLATSATNPSPITSATRWRLSSHNSSNTQVTLPIYMYRNTGDQTLRVYVDQATSATYDYECVGYY